ncbi:MAG: hypothetical protein ACLQUZ_09195 [Rhizomicrobium sp.]
MVQLSGHRVLVTGASGLVAFPVAVELAKSNEVYAVARYSDPEQKRMIEAAGARRCLRPCRGRFVATAEIS